MVGLLGGFCIGFTESGGRGVREDRDMKWRFHVLGTVNDGSMRMYL